MDRPAGWAIPLPSLCWVLSVSVNGYRAWKRGGKSGQTRLTGKQLLTLGRKVHAAVKGLRFAAHDRRNP